MCDARAKVDHLRVEFDNHVLVRLHGTRLDAGECRVVSMRRGCIVDFTNTEPTPGLHALIHANS